MTGVAIALPINGEKVGPLIGVVGADSDCLHGKISSANQTLLLPLGGVPMEKQRFRISVYVHNVERRLYTRDWIV